MTLGENICVSPAWKRCSAVCTSPLPSDELALPSPVSVACLYSFSLNDVPASHAAPHLTALAYLFVFHVCMASCCVALSSSLKLDPIDSPGPQLTNFCAGTHAGHMIPHWPCTCHHVAVLTRQCRFLHIKQPFTPSLQYRVTHLSGSVYGCVVHSCGGRWCKAGAMCLAGAGAQLALTTNLSRWMLVPSSQVSLDGATCNMAGTGYTAFANQAVNPSVPPPPPSPPP